MIIENFSCNKNFLSEVPCGKIISVFILLFSHCFVFDISLSAIAKKRPAYYGRILPVLLSLDPPSFVIKGVHVYGAHHALKNALLSCLKCKHPSAAPVFILY